MAGLKAESKDNSSLHQTTTTHDGEMASTTGGGPGLQRGLSSRHLVRQTTLPLRRTICNSAYCGLTRRSPADDVGHRRSHWARLLCGDGHGSEQRGPCRSAPLLRRRRRASLGCNAVSWRARCFHPSVRFVGAFQQCLVIWFGLFFFLVSR